LAVALRPPGRQPLAGSPGGPVSLASRFYADYLMRSRSGEYRAFLELAGRQGYQTLSIIGFSDLVRRGGLNPAACYLVLRHDIDTRCKFTGVFFEIERELEVYSSYYFRLCTIDIPLMRSISASGREVSYHYEELATFAKRHALRSATEVQRHLPTIRRMFEANLADLRQRTQLPMRSAASHGDFANRRLELPNTVVLDDVDLRRRTGIEIETYDFEIMQHVTARCTDQPYPVLWRPVDPADAIRKHSPVVYVLTHPRHWGAAVMGNFRADWSRLREGVQFRFGLPVTRQDFPVRGTVRDAPQTRS
jgi:hypothetical protein